MICLVLRCNFFLSVLRFCFNFVKDTYGYIGYMVKAKVTDFLLFLNFLKNLIEELLFYSETTETLSYIFV